MYVWVCVCMPRWVRSEDYWEGLCGILWEGKDKQPHCSLEEHTSSVQDWVASEVWLSTRTMTLKMLQLSKKVAVTFNPHVSEASTCGTGVCQKACFTWPPSFLALAQLIAGLLHPPCVLKMWETAPGCSPAPSGHLLSAKRLMALKGGSPPPLMHCTLRRKYRSFPRDFGTEVREVQLERLGGVWGGRGS